MENEKTTYIYTISDENGNVRYIGKSNNPKRRIYQHINEKFNKHKYNWLQYNHIGFEKKLRRTKYQQSIIKYSINGETIEEYSSTNKAARENGVTAKKIKRLCEVGEEFNGVYFKLSK